MIIIEEHLCVRNSLDTTSNQAWSTSGPNTKQPASAYDALQHAIVGMLFRLYSQILNCIDIIVNGLVWRGESIYGNVSDCLSEALVIHELAHALGAMHQPLEPFHVDGTENNKHGKSIYISENNLMLEDLGALSFGVAETKEQEQRLLERPQRLDL